MHDLEPVIISRKRKSVIYGAQYLHKPIPGITEHDSAREIKTIRRGTEDRYAQRVYGDAQAVTSWRRVVPSAFCWNLRKSYEAAWEKFAENIVDWELTPSDIEDFEQQFDLVISTIPLWIACQGKHEFQSIPTLVKHDIEGVDCSLVKNFVVYNGTTDGEWYRASNIFGHESKEAPSLPELEGQGWESGFKVVGNNCDCNPNIVRAGRMGMWERGVLTHNAFDTTVEAISDRLGLVMSGGAGSV